MSSIYGSITLLVAFITILISASPLPNTTPQLDVLKARTPVSNVFADSWPTNVIFEGGAQSFGMWIPVDGSWYDLSTITCLDEPAYAEGPCNLPTVDQIGVVAGNGPCSFVGSDGFSITIQGVAGEGYYSVGPPQTIIMAACG